MQILINFLYFVGQLMVAYLFVCAAIDYACKKNCDYKVSMYKQIIEAIDEVYTKTVGGKKNGRDAS